MKVVQINSFSNGSTGKIMMSIHEELLKQGYDSYVVWGRGRKSNNYRELYLNDKIGVYFHAFYSRITGKTGFASKISTKKLLKRLDEINPDIIHLHNLHGYYINIEMLFNYIKNKHIKVVWTLHDCWAFTGQCPHFTLCKCDKWKNGCYNCPMIVEYPKSLKDNSKNNYLKKKELFTGLNMSIVTPSNWLSHMVKDSFLKKYNIRVINNGIDIETFKKTKSDFKIKYKISEKKIILGVASVWDRRKGLDDFIKISKKLPEDYIIVLIGISKKQMRILPKNVIGIMKTENQKELAEIYSVSTVLFNPTYEDTYPTVNLEALSCGLPVITYNSGGSPESSFASLINDENIIKIDEDLPEKVIEKAQKIKLPIFSRDNISYKNMTDKYMSLYKEVFNNEKNY